MSVGILGKRYARALLQLATESDAVERIGKDLREFANMWESQRELRAVFENPGVAQKSRQAILRDLGAQAGIHEHVLHVLLLLSDRSRLRHIEEIADAYEALAEARSGRLRAEVTTATPLPASYYTELERVLREVTGKQVVLGHKVDPSLIAGVVTRIGDQVFDGSVKSRLTELKQELLK